MVEAGGVQVSVDLGGLDAGMSQQLLQHPQVGAAGMHVGGKGMAQHVSLSASVIRLPDRH